MRVWIWSGEHGAYWRPNRAGYTASPAEAGVYEKAEAEEILRHCGPEKRLRLEPVVPSGSLIEMHRLIAEFRRVAEGLPPPAEPGYAWRSQVDPFTTPEWRALCAAANAWEK